MTAATNQQPQQVFSRLKAFCREQFGSDGDFVYKFYTYFFSPTKFKNQGATLNMTTDMKIRNIMHLIEISGKENVLACINKFHDNFKKGVIKTHSIQYFTAAAEKYKASPSELKEIKSSVSIPVKFMRVRDEFDDDSYNWDYKCSCGEIIDPWTSCCKKCNSIIDWRNSNV